VMIVHHRSHLGERPFKCVDCRKPHRWASDLKTHYKLHQQENLYAYENHKFADDLPSIQKHVVKKHAGEKGYKQNLHQQSYSGSGVHVLKPKYTNNECAKNYLKYGGIKKHLLLKPNLKRLHCDTCSKSFKSKNFMRLHVGMHAVLGEIKLQAAIIDCRRLLQKIYDLEKPMRQKRIMDANVKKEAPYCISLNGQKSYSNFHTIKCMIVVNPYMCTQCDKRYPLKYALNRHVKSIHTKESAVECKVCLKVFNDRTNLLRHVRHVHDKIKEHECGKCDKKFAHSHHLRTHMRLHTNEKPYSCSYCERTFFDQSGLLQHEIRTHTKKFPHLCKDCPKRFMTPGMLDKHVKKKH